MMRKMNLTLTVITILTVVTVGVKCHSSKAKDLFVPFSKLEKIGERYLQPVDKVDTEEEAKAILLRCTQSYMEIKIKTNVFGKGVPVQMEHFALLGKVPVEKTCRAFLSDGYYNVVAPLTECGTRSLVG